MAGERLVLKVGTNVVTQPDQHLDYNVIHQLVEDIGELRARGHQVVLVASGARGSSWKLVDFGDEKDGQLQRRMMAAVGQPRLMQLYGEFFHEQGVVIAQALLTRHDFGHRERYLGLREMFEGLLKRGVLPVVNENDAVSGVGLSFGDNDYLSAAVAANIGAQRLFLLTSTEGFYLGGAVEHHTEARLVKEVCGIDQEMWDSCSEEFSWGGQGGMRSKLKAAEIVTACGIDVYILSGRQAGGVLRVLEGEAVGTHIVAEGKRPRSFQQWLRVGAFTWGRVVVDAGAAKALGNKKSLLPAGIVAVEGKFSRGEVVEIHMQGGAKLGLGVAELDSRELMELLDSHVRGGREAIHRDRLLLL